MQELTERFSTRGQAKFHVARMVEMEKFKVAGAAPEAAAMVHEEAEREFSDYEEEHQIYHDAVAQIRRDLEDLGPKLQPVDRSFITNFVFGPNDIVVTVGQDGLVANTAKYALQL